jgi:hypothetical protein
LVSSAVGCSSSSNFNGNADAVTTTSINSDAVRRLIDAGLRPDLARCLESYTTKDLTEIRAASDFEGEVIGEARFRRCYRAARPSSETGRQKPAGDGAAFIAAVRQELTTPVGADAFRPNEASCLARKFVRIFGIRALRDAGASAGDVASYLQGRAAPSDLNLEVNPTDAEALAQAMMVCVNAPELQAQLWTYPGNVREWSGTSLEDSEIARLQVCISREISPVTTLAQVRAFLERGPSAFRDSEGRTQLQASLDAFATCSGKTPRLRH